MLAIIGPQCSYGFDSLALRDLLFRLVYAGIETGTGVHLHFRRSTPCWNSTRVL